jgi:hypothetical protein
MSKVGSLKPSLIAAALTFAHAATAADLLLIDDTLDVLPAGYTLTESASTNATASMQIGNLGSSNGLIFDGSWDVPVNGQETAVGAMVPVIPTPADFQLDPADVDGIAGIRWMLDVQVSSSTMAPPEQGIFVQLTVFQLQPDGTVLGFADGGTLIDPGAPRTLDLIAIESDFGQPGARPDFSAVGLPMSFGLQMGATYPRTINPAAFFVDGRMTGDNWRVEIVGGAGIFNDSFESEPTVTRALEPTSEQDESCNCPIPPILRATVLQP